MWAQTLAINSSSMPLPHHDLQGHKHLCCTLILRRVGEYFRANYTFAPLSFTPMSFNTTLTLTTLHLKSNGYFPFFLKNYELNQYFEFYFILSSWHSNPCCIYWQVILLGCFLTCSRLFSPRRFNEWIPSIVLTLFSYCIRSNFILNCT